jgi:hypothetical protein
MNAEQIEKSLKGAFQAAEGKPPPFTETLAAAEQRVARSGTRLKAVTGMAAALVAALVFWPAQESDVTDEFLIAESLLNSTTWSAPSDALMPEHQFDIYQETPFLNESTISPEGTLL